MKKAFLFSYSFLFILSLIFTNSAFSQQKMIIAVLDLKPGGVSKPAAQAITDIVRSEFVNVANFTVVERGAMDEILAEQGLQASGCTDASCAVQIGKMLSARKIITGEINLIGKSVMLTLRIIDVEKGVSDYSAREKSESLEKVDTAAVSIARKLTQRIVSGEKEFFTPISAAGYYSRSIIPGWGQMYAGNNTHAAFSAGGFVLSGLLSYYMYTKYQDKRDTYNSANPGSADFSTLRDEYRSSSDMYYYSLGLVGAVYLAHWIDVVFFTAPDFGTATAADKAQEDDIFFALEPVHPVEGNDREKGVSLSAGMRF